MECALMNNLIRNRILSDAIFDQDAVSSMTNLQSRICMILSRLLLLRKKHPDRKVTVFSTTHPLLVCRI